MKQNVTKFDLEAAFKALDEIEMPKAEEVKANRPILNESMKPTPKTDCLLEDYYDVSDQNELAAAQEERDDEIAKAKLARIEKIVDLDAESPEDIQPSYAGKMIIQCPQCMTLFYKDEADLAKSEDDPNTVNVGEVCQHCGNDQGYMLIGKVAPVSQEEQAQFTGEQAPAEAPAEGEAAPAEEAPAEAPAEETPAPAEETPATTEEAPAEEEALPAADETEEEKPEEEEKKEESFAQPTGEALTEAAKDKEFVIYTVYKDGKNDKEEKVKGLTSSELHKLCKSKKAEDKNVDTVYVSELRDGKEIPLDQYMEGLNEAADKKYRFFTKYSDGEMLHCDKTGILPREIHEICNDLAGDDDVDAVYVSELVNGKEIPLDKYTIDKVAVNNDEIDAFDRAMGVEESLTESADKELDKKLKEHNDYIDYLQKMISQEETALKAPEAQGNEFVKAAIQRRLDAFKADLEAAIPEEVKSSAETEELPTAEEAGATEAPAEPAPAEEAPKTESLKESKASSLLAAFAQSLNSASNNPADESLEESEENKEKLDAFEDEVNQITEDAKTALNPKDFEVKGDVSNSEFKSMINSSAFKAFDEGCKNCEEKQINEAAEDETEEDATAADAADVAEQESTLIAAGREAAERAEQLKAECDALPAEDEEPEELQDSYANKVITNYLSEVYSNVKGFEMTECSMNNGKLIIEGKINFESGKSKSTRFEFKNPCNEELGIVSYTGINEGLGKDGSYTLKFVKENGGKLLVAESLAYKCNIDNTLVEGLAKAN